MVLTAATEESKEEVKEEAEIDSMEIEPSRRQTCKVCGRPDKFDFHVPEEVWEAVIPPPIRKKVVCLYCFDEFAYLSNFDYSKQLERLYFAGDQATFEFRASTAIAR